jgi:hypothetical protein
MDMQYSFDFLTAGNDAEAQVANGTAECYLHVPKEHWMLTQIKDAPQEESQTDPETMVKVPLYWFAMCFDEAYSFATSQFTVNHFAADSLIHAQTMAYTADTAYAQNFHINSDGELKSWLSAHAFSTDFAAWARLVIRVGNDVAPVTIYLEDRVAIANPPFPQTVDWLNHLYLLEAEAGGNAMPWMRLQWLLYPLTPTLDLTDNEADQTILAKLLASTARSTFTAMSDTSMKMAVIRLLSTKIPYQLLPSKPWDITPSLTRRADYIYMLGEWALPTRNEVALVQTYFTDVLLYYPTLASWIEELADPYSTLKDMLAQGPWPDTHVLDLSGMRFMDDALASDDYAALWSEDSTHKDNVDYLLVEFRRRRDFVRSAARVGSTSDSTGNAGRDGAPAAFAQELASLHRTMLDHFGNNGNDFQAIELIEKSGAVPAIRFLHGFGVPVTALPPSFTTLCSAFPTKMHEYLIDTMKHDDAGNLDVDLADLTVATLYSSKGGGKFDKFYTDFIGGKYTRIHWDKDFVGPIAQLLDPNAKVFENMSATLPRKGPSLGTLPPLLASAATGMRRHTPSPARYGDAFNAVDACVDGRRLLDVQHPMLSII